jgi:hypothetical protein
MLAQKRDICVGDKLVAETPLLIPSFSSKGFPQLGEIVSIASEYITECALISAYDIHYEHLKEAPLTFPAFWTLDSGGFECGTLEELSELHYSIHKPKAWNVEMLAGVLDNWSQAQPTIAVSYDNPNRRISIKEQVVEARDLFDKRAFGRELLIKPETLDQERVQIPNVIENIDSFAGFNILGFTEKELGYSLFQRVKNIGKIRKALNEAKLDIPIHVFGSLDMVSTPLYFLAGADIFDGLTWLRFAYRDGRAIYMRDLAAIDPQHYGSRINDVDVRPRVLWENLQQIWNLGHSMKTFCKTGAFSSFEHHAAFLEKTLGEADIDFARDK